MKRRLLPKYVSAFLDRHGRERLRFRKAGLPSRYLKAAFGTEAFRVELRACLDAATVADTSAADRATPGSINDLVGRYYRSSAWVNRTAGAQKHDRRIIESFRAEHGEKLVRNLKFQHIDAILAARSKTPVAANKLRKQLRRLMAYAMAIEMISRDPTALSKSLPVKSKGYHTWTEDEIGAFQAHHPIGSKARLALELMLWTGQRRGDAIRMGPSHVRDGRIRIEQGKTGTALWIPIAPQLLAAIVAMPPGGATFLATEHGRPFTPAGFGNWFRERSNEAGLPRCSAHGLRKSMARRLAEINQSNQSIKAVTGHKKDDEVALYTAAADQIGLADAAIKALAAWETGRKRLAITPDLPSNSVAD